MNVLRSVTASESRQYCFRFKVIFIWVVFKVYSYRVVSIEQSRNGIEECPVLCFESTAAFQNFIACSANVNQCESEKENCPTHAQNIPGGRRARFAT